MRKEIRALIATSSPGEIVEVEPRPGEEVEDLVLRLEGEMLSAAERLEFERAAELRDRISRLKEAVSQRELGAEWAERA